MLTSIRLAVLPILGLLGSVAVSVSPAHAYDREITLVNRSQHTITSFFASNTGRSSWEEDILGTHQRVVYPGQSVNIDLNDGSGYCRFDFRTVLDNSITVTRARVDVCTVTTYTIYD